MAENIHIDLSEEIEQDLTRIYQDLSDNLTQEFHTMYDQLEEICNQTQYEPMVNVVNSTIELFNDDIHDVAVQAFEDWIDGEGSFQAAAENSQAGEDANETAKQIERELEDIFDTFWSSEPLNDGVQVDTSRPKIKDEDFDELQEIYTKTSQKVAEVNEKSVNEITEKGSDDPTYNVMIPAVKAITEPVKEAFEKFGDKIKEAKEQSKSLKQQQDAKNKDASENATNTTASAADTAESLKMFADI